MPHVFNNRVRSGDLDVLFSAAGGARGAYVLIGVATSADDRRIAAASGEFVGEAAGGGAARDFTFVVKSGSVNRAGRRNQNAPDGGHAEFRLDAKLDGALFEATNALLPKLGLRCGRW